MPVCTPTGKDEFMFPKNLTSEYFVMLFFFLMFASQIGEK